MSNRNLVFLALIVVLAAVLIWIDLPTNPGIRIPWLGIDADIRIHQGLDLQGGTHVLLEADMPAGEVVTSDAMEAARVVVENRVNGLGVDEPLVQLQGQSRIVVQLPGIDDPDRALETIRGTGLLEFVDGGGSFLAEGTTLRTTLGETGELVPPASASGPIMSTGEVPTPAAGATPDAAAAPVAGEPIYPTIMTGRHLQTASVGTDELGRPEIRFEMTQEGAQLMAEYSRSHVGDTLAILMDKVVISAPTIQTPITEGSGRITSQQGFPLEVARSLSVQLRYGALPVPLTAIETRTVGPTLGQDSVEKSIRAALVGLIVVLIFMAVYYRVPGLLANVALLLFAGLNLALYKTIPVTLTLPGITGFILAIGMAVDANILIFERMKEELRAGRSMRAAVEAGFDRAWTSIRDSNLSTMLTCVILFWFGSNFGAGVVKGFAVTLFLGVLTSMFTAIFVSRTFMRFLVGVTGERLRNRKALLGTH